MNKTAARKTTGPLKVSKVRDPKRAFYSGLFDMTWRLLIAMAIPVLGGAYLDKKFDSDDLFTAFGVLLSLVTAGYVIKSTVEKLTPEDAK